MKTQLNSMWKKANVLKTIGQPLNDLLIAIAMVISLPMSYLTLHTILMAVDDQLTTDMVINQVLIKERSKKLPGQTALSAKVVPAPTVRKMAIWRTSAIRKNEMWLQRTEEIS